MKQISIFMASSFIFLWKKKAFCWKKWKYSKETQVYFGSILNSIKVDEAQIPETRWSRFGCKTYNIILGNVFPGSVILWYFVKHSQGIEGYESSEGISRSSKLVRNVTNHILWIVWVLNAQSGRICDGLLAVPNYPGNFHETRSPHRTCF